jgi:hypothetical protein
LTHDLEHIGIRRHAEHERLTVGGECRRIGGGVYGEFAREGPCLLGGAIPDTLEHPCPVKISRHGHTHGAESEEADTHRGILTGCGKAKKIG